MLAALLAFSLIAMQFPAVAIAQDAPPQTSPSEEPVVETESPPTETEESEPVIDDSAPDVVEQQEQEDAPDDQLPPEDETLPGLTDDTQLPVDLDLPKDEPESGDEEDEAPALFSAQLRSGPPQTSPVGPDGPSCVILSDEQTLEGGSASFEVSKPHHTSWTAVVDALAKWIWGDDPVADPEAETVQTFTRTFSVSADASGGTLVIAADNSYVVELDGVQLHKEADESNYLESQVETIAIDASDLTAGTHTLTFTVKNLAMDGGTQETNPAGLKYKLTIHDATCGDPEPTTATLVATKIVCPLESELPNWGAGAADIDEDTAAEFLAAHPSCHLDPDWQFEWVTDDESDTNPGDNSGVAGSPWSLFGPTGGDGSVSTEIPAGGKVWVREILKKGFTPFTGQNTDQDVSAEMYCSTDVLNYDNWDWIDPVEAGETYYCVAFNAPATSQVTMCKVDEEGVPLAGWQLTLAGDEVGSVAVRPDGDDYEIEDVGPGSYLVTATGQYVYRPGEPTASTSDAAYSLRHPSDPVYFGPNTPWVRVNDFPHPHMGWLGIQMNESFTDWGSTFYPHHTYALATSTDLVSDFVFRILDDVHSDNSGDIEVTVAQGFTGTTGVDGCVTFDNVPYGTYEAGELLKEGWETVSGTGPVVVDEPEETFTIVNTDNPIPADSARVIATKVICDSEEDLPNNSMGKPITAATAAEWVAASDGACWLAEGWEFEWGNQNAGDGGPATIGHAPNYTTFGTTDVNGVAQVDIPLAGITTIQMREVLKEGYIPFTNGGDESAEFYCASDAAGYDNWEWITNPAAGATYHCVAFNAPVDPADDGKSSITIVKQSVGGTGSFQINVKDEFALFPDPFDWTASITTTEDGVASSSMQFAPPDTYVVEETVPEGWELTSVSCTGEVATTSPLTVTVEAEEDVTCTFVNTKVEPRESEIIQPEVDEVTSGTTELLAYYADENGDGNDAVQWAVREGTCEAGTNTRFGNVDGYNTPFTWNNVDFFAEIDTTTVPNGQYCFVFNPTEDGGDANQRLTRLFMIENPDDEEPTKPDEVTVTITGDTAAGENQPGWLFNRDKDTQSPFAFVLGNASIGTGSLFVEPIENDINGNSDKFIAELFLLEETADVDSITYDFKIGAPDDTVEEQFYASVYMNFGSTSPTNFYDCRYSVVPTVGSTGSYTTVTFDPTQSYPVTTRGSSPHPCPSVPADMDTVGIGSSTVRVIALNVGDTSASDLGVGGYLDKVVVSLTDLITTYDFEPTNDSIVPEDEDGGGGGGGGGSTSFASARARGAVLGASTAACEVLLTTFMKMGNTNDPAEVVELQGFLNEHMGAGLPLTGVFGPMTDAAVHAFQKQYWQEVLAPWFAFPESGIADADDSTGFVYKTTQWKINDIACPGLVSFPTLP